LFSCISPLDNPEHHAPRRTLVLHKADLCEAHLFKQTMHLVAGVESIDGRWEIRHCSRVLFGAEAEHKTRAGLHHAVNFLEMSAWIRPEVEGVDRVHPVEVPIRVRNSRAVSTLHLDPALLDALPVPGSGHPHHVFRHVNAGHESPWD